VDIVVMLRIEDTEQGERRLLYVHPQRGKQNVEAGVGQTKSVPFRMIAKDRTHSFPSGVVDVTYSEAEGWTSNITKMMQHITETLMEREKEEAS